MKGIILHGGHGTRLRPLTHTGPKQLLPIANKPMSQYCVESLKNADINDIAIVVGGIGSNKVREYYGDGEKFGVKITYIEQDLPRGIAHAVGLCKEFVGNSKFVVFLGDNIIKNDITDYVKNFEKSDAKALILLCKVSNPTQFGVAEIFDGKIKKLIEKPKNPQSDLAVIGIYFLSPLIFDIIDNLKPSWRNELEIIDALQQLVDNNYNLTFDIITDFWKDTGTPDDIIHANGIILEKMIPYFYGIKEDNVSISGNVLVGKDTLIKSGSSIKGPVIIGKNCIIDNNTKIGPNTSIGDNSHLSGCEIENSIVMKNCFIQSNIKIRNSIIAFNSKIESKSESQDESVFLLGEGTKITL
jgi:glucose-1-phosphate thymidylyltransferase